MTVPPGTGTIPTRLRDWVRQRLHSRQGLSPQENDLAVHLRGNESLYNALVAVIKSQMEGRAAQPEPTDPLDCKSMIARDRELQRLLSRLKRIHTAPLTEGEQPE